jgi:hypothetical protein
MFSTTSRPSERPSTVAVKSNERTCSLMRRATAAALVVKVWLMAWVGSVG